MKANTNELKIVIVNPLSEEKIKELTERITNDINLKYLANYK